VASCRANSWIADDNYGGTLDIRLADTVVVLTLPRWRCTLHALKRTSQNRGEEIEAKGCPETFDIKTPVGMALANRQSATPRPGDRTISRPAERRRARFEVRSTVLFRRTGLNQARWNGG
jgi:adenylate kinase family enzyme